MGNRHIPDGMVSDLKKALDANTNQPDEAASVASNESGSQPPDGDRTKPRRRHLAMDCAFSTRFFDFRPMLNSIIALNVFVYAFGIMMNFTKRSPMMFRSWLHEQPCGLSLFELVMVINALFALYALLEIITSVQRKQTTLLGAFNYGATMLVFAGMLQWGLNDGEARITAYSLAMGPWPNEESIVVDYPRPEGMQDSSYSSCYPEDAILVSLDGNRLVIGDDVANPFPLKDGTFVSKKLLPGRVGPWIPELGNRLKTSHERWEAAKPKSEFRKYRLIPPEMISEFEIWPSKRGTELIIKAGRNTPFKTIETIVASAGERGFGKWCLWGREFETELIPEALALPRFAILDGTENFTNELDLRVHLKAGSLSLSFNKDQGSTREQLELTGNNQLEELASNLETLKEFHREETRCLMEVDTDVPFEKVVNAIVRMSGLYDKHLFPDVLFLKHRNR